jgi:hypothetical protein
MKLYALIYSVFVLFASSQAQKFACTSGEVSFFSKTVQEDIDAKTNSAVIMLESSRQDVDQALHLQKEIDAGSF